MRKGKKQRERVVKLRIMALKLTAVLYSLSQSLKTRGHLGSALRLLELAGVASLLFSPQTRQEQLLLGSLLTLAGDIFFDIPRIITESTLEYHKSSSKFCSIERDLTLQREPYKRDPTKPPTVAEMLTLTEDITLDPEVNLKTSSQFYMRALNQISREGSNADFISITRKLGNSQNQLGIHFLQTRRYTKAVWNFTLGVDTFKTINDNANIALLYCNLGHVMRVYAEEERSVIANTNTTSSSEDSFSSQEESHYQKSIQFYLAAQEALGNDTAFPDIWNQVHTELATTYLSMGTRIMQGRHDETQEAAELMQKSLQMFKNLKAERHIARAHFSLARVYAMMIKQNNTQRKTSQQQQMHLAMTHYKKALAVYTSNVEPNQFVQITAEVMELLNISSIGSKSANMREALEYAFELDQVSSPIEKAIEEQALNAISSVLRELIKYYSSKKKQTADGYKALFKELLSGSNRSLPDTMHSIRILDKTDRKSVV